MTRRSPATRWLVATALLTLAWPSAVWAQDPAPQPDPAASERLPLVEFRGVPLGDALRLLSIQSGLNLAASRSASAVEVDLYLRNVTPVAALETLCSSHDLWVKRGDDGVYQVRTAREYRRDVQGLRAAKLEVFTLLYPNAVDAAYAVRDLFGSRVRFGLGADLQEDFQELTQRFQRFDMIDGRSQGFGTLQGLQGQNQNQNNQGLRNQNLNANQLRNQNLGRQQHFNQNGNNGRPSRVDTADLAEDRVSGLSAEQIRALEQSGEAGQDVIDRVFRQASIYVSVNRKNNQLLVRTGDVEALEQIRRMVKRMDVPTPLVLLEVKVMSIELGDGFDSVFDYQFSDGSSSASGFTTGNVLPPASDVIGGPDSLRRASPLGLGGDGLLNDRLIYQFVGSHFRARLQLLEDERRITTLATPILLTANNEVSRLFAGEERPLNRGFTAGQTVVTAGASTVTPGSTNIEFRPIGTTLLLTPNINADRTVTLRVLQETSTINVGGASVLVPSGTGFIQQAIDTVQSRSVSGTIVARHGNMVAIGGLIEEELRDLREGVPWISKIPLLGFFFRRQETEKVRRELVITIRPFVLSTPKESEQLSRRLLGELSIHPTAPGARGTLQTYDKSDVLKAPTPNSAGELFHMFDLHTLGDDDE